jgi:hypothetical protein
MGAAAFCVVTIKVEVGNQSRMDSNQEISEGCAEISCLYIPRQQTHDFSCQKDLPCILLYPGAYSGVRDAGKED